MRELETLYGVELFHRHPNGVTLTNVARELLVIIRRMQANQQDAIQYLQTVQDMRIGHLRIGSYGPYDVIEILAEFTRRYPSLTCSLTFANSMKLHAELLNHNLDVAVFTDVEATPEFHSLAYNKIKQVAIVGKSHPWRNRKSIQIKNLKGERLIIRESGSEARRATEEALKASDVPPATIIEIGSGDGAVAAVAQGMGACLIFDVDTISDNLVTKLHIRSADIVAHVDVVCLAERKNSRIIGCFLEVAGQLLEEKKN